MNADLLKGKIRENAMTQETVAKSIGISLSRFNAKLNGTDGAEFSLGEAKALIDLFGLRPEQIDQIFFT